MKKFILFFSVMFVLCTNLNLFAQISNYTFSSFTGAYNEIAGDTVARATHTSIDPFQLNDVTYGALALPFTFVYNCLDYDSYFINSNGFITFGSTGPILANYGAISSSETYDGSVSAFSLDLIGVFGTTIDFSGVTNVLTDVQNFQGVVVGAHITAATGIPANTFITAFDAGLGTITISNNTTDIIVNNLVVQISGGMIIRSTEGTSPNRIHTIEWKNFRQYIIIGTDDNFNFQIKLYEATAQIRVIYGNMDKNTAPVASVAGQVGLRGFDNTDFNNRTNTATSNWGISAAGTTNAVTSLLSSTVFPVTGQTYTWTPICPLPVEMSSFVSSINGRDVTLNWTTVSESNNSRFEIERTIVNGQWSKIGSVEGNGTTLSAMNYAYTDRGLNTGLYNYRLKQIDFNGNFEYFNLNNEVNVGIPSKFALMQNYPNPFNPSTTINYDLPSDGVVTLKIFDLTGKEVSALVNEFKAAGYYTINFTGNNLSSGIYIYSLTSNDLVITKKMTLLK
ncbi:MAG: T9SS type A sorting domain-containing protein [Ignavibacteria bacterium]|nr:T9SS type A sorting domain-containing protein [Ignavibacteria bacterium]